MPLKRVVLVVGDKALVAMADEGLDVENAARAVVEQHAVETGAAEIGAVTWREALAVPLFRWTRGGFLSAEIVQAIHVVEDPAAVLVEAEERILPGPRSATPPPQAVDPFAEL